MKIQLEITEEDIKKYVINILDAQYNINLDITDIRFEVKTKQNYRAEWESGQMRAQVEKSI